MKKVLVPVLAGAVGLAAGYAMRGAPPATPPAVIEQQKTQAIQSAMTPVEGQVVHTFADEAQMREFAQRWQQRQLLLVRLAMLEGYWNNEQSTLNTVNQKIMADYNLDISKNYLLDSARKVILEQPAAAAGDAGAAAGTPPATPPAGGETVAYTFADEAAMETFARLWQQRQSIIVRMAVLKAYFDSEKAGMTDLEQGLIKDYHMDLAKQYTLDDQRRVLIERPAAPVDPSAPAAIPGQPAAPASPQQPGAPAPAQAPQQR